MRFDRLVLVGLLLAAAPTAAGTTAVFPPTGSPTTVSTVPGTGDQNPYGVAFVPKGFPTKGLLQPGDILVSNFNASSNLQGSGTTIMRVHDGATTVFFQGVPMLGLTTALTVLKSGFVLVGNIPSPDGTCGHASNGSLMILDDNGNLVESFSRENIIDGPWDMTVWDDPVLPVAFVSNALNGTVVRLDLAVGGPFGISVHSATTIAKGYTHQCDPVTFIDGPTGLAYRPGNDTLYVASTADNQIYRVAGAALLAGAVNKGTAVVKSPSYLNGPLHLAFAPNGHLITGNNDNIISGSKVPPSEYVELTAGGVFVAAFQIDPNPGGAFGFAFNKTGATTATFAAVDDNQSNLQIWTVNY